MQFILEPIKVIGYHGTSQGAAQKILREGFKPSTNDWEWLGHGIYFWQDAPYRAYQWGKDWLARRYGYQGPLAVVAAEIKLDNFIDLLDTVGMDALREISRLHATLPEAQGLSNNQARNRLDCSLFNLATKLLSSGNSEVNGYRAACVEGTPLTAESPVYDLSHVQVVVCEPKAIIRVWEVEAK